MPSPFPGMDPFLEGPLWSDFHSAFIHGVRRQLSPLLMPRYVLRVEHRIYIDSVEGDLQTSIRRPDGLIALVDHGSSHWSGPTTAVLEEPAMLTQSAPLPIEVREPFLTIQDAASSEVVATIELLSPGNKRKGGDGRREYLAKRALYLNSSSHLVEFDLLRGGERLPTHEALPPGDQFIFVSRVEHRPQVAVYPSHLRRRLPSIPIPLRGPESQVPLDVQAVVDDEYQTAGYGYSIDYRGEPDPPLSADDRAWLDARLAASATNGGV